MKYAHAITVISFVTLATLGCDDGKKDRDAVQGFWIVDSIDTTNGIISGDYPWRVHELSISGNTFKLYREGGETESGTFDIDPNKKELTFKGLKHDDRDGDRLALYDMPVGRLRICMFTKGTGQSSFRKSRPSEFAADKQGDVVVYVFKRK